MINIFIPIGVVLFVGFISYIVSRIIYKKLGGQETKKALPISIITFILCSALLIGSIGFFIISNMTFSRGSYEPPLELDNSKPVVND